MTGAHTQKLAFAQAPLGPATADPQSTHPLQSDHLHSASVCQSAVTGSHVLPEEEEQTYLAGLVSRLTSSLGPRLVGVYLFGWASNAACGPRHSDLDVQAIETDTLTLKDNRAVTQRLAQQALPCPAEKVEPVVRRPRPNVNPANRLPRFVANTGLNESEHVLFDLGSESSHGLLIDIVIGGSSGIALCDTPLD